jgi:hypothetical protein
MKKLLKRLYNPRVKKTLKPFLFLIISTIMILSIFQINFLNLELKIQENINNELENNYLNLNITHNGLIKEYNILLLNHSNLLNNYDSLLLNYYDFDEKFNELENNYTTFENNINFQLSYFRENSNIKNIIEYKNIKEQLNKCFNYYTINTYKINLACINFVLSHESEGNNFIYKNDSRNELLSLSEFYNNKGGDCDDWARAYYASYNYIKSVIKNLNPNNQIILETYGGTCSQKQNFYLTNENEWYINTCIVNLNNYEYSYPICGTKSEEAYGHCWVAFTENKINSTKEVNEVITKSIIIEPQSGEYIFSYPQSMLQDYNYYIIMTENDLIMKTYTKDENSWKGYLDYYNEVMNKKENINILINNLI